MNSTNKLKIFYLNEKFTLCLVVLHYIVSILVFCELFEKNLLLEQYKILQQNKFLFFEFKI